MTVDEAVRLLESNGPADGDWKSWRAAWLEAQLLLEEVSAQTLDRFAPRLRKVCVSFPNIDAQKAAAVPLVRWALARGELDELVALHVDPAVRAEAAWELAP